MPRFRRTKGPRFSAHSLFAVFCAAVLLTTTTAVFADQNWDGDNAAGNFSFNNNWFSDVQPTWGFSNGNLVFNFKNNAAQTSLFYDYGFFQNTNDIFFASTFPNDIVWDGNGQGLNFNQRFENDSSHTITLGSMKLSGAKNGANHIELNPVNGDLIISSNSSIFNDNSVPYQVFGNNGHTLAVNTNLGVGSNAGSVSFTNESANNVIFGANQSYAGGTNISGSGGKVQLGNGGTAGNAGSGTITMVGNTTLAFNRSDSPSFSNAITMTGTSTGQSNAGFFDVASGTAATLTGAISSAGEEFWKTSAGTLTVNNSSNSFNVSVVIKAGTLQTDSLSNGGSNSSLGKGSIFIGQGGSGTLTYTGGTATTDRIGANALQGSTSNTINVSNSTTNLTISSGIGQTVTATLTKDGAGALTLTGANTYSGGTIVSAGTLFANSSSATGSGNVTVNNSGTIAGSGTITGTVTLNNSATINGGGTSGTVGTLATGALTLNNTSILSADMTATTADKIAVTGTVTLTSTAALQLNIPNGTTFAPNQQFTLIDDDGTDAISGTFSNAPMGTDIINGYAWIVSYTGGTGNDFVLTAVPEPGTWAAGALACAVIGYQLSGIRRRRAIR